MVAFGLACPKFRFEIGPQASPRSLFASRFEKSQSGMKFLFVSVHVRVALRMDVTTGLAAFARASVWLWT